MYLILPVLCHSLRGHSEMPTDYNNDNLQNPTLLRILNKYSERSRLAEKILTVSWMT